MEKNPGFLKEKYSFHTAPEVEAAAKRTAEKTGVAVTKDPLERIQNYLDRFNDIAARPDPEDRSRGVHALERILYRQHIINPKDVPESYWDHQRQIIIDQGRAGDFERDDQGKILIAADAKEQLAEVLVEDQKSSLNTWVEYFASDNAPFPDWLKYWALRSIVSMGGYDKARNKFSDRSRGSVEPFPDLNPEALANVFRLIKEKYAGVTGEEERQVLDDKIEKLLAGGNFSKLYALAIEKFSSTSSREMLLHTEGQWVKFPHRSSEKPLVASLQSHNTGWCTAEPSTAQLQLQGGDFYVFYSQNLAGQAIVPRAAIRMHGTLIAEVRGIASGQNLDPFIIQVVNKKLDEFKDGKSYQKKSADTERVTAVSKKIKTGQSLDDNEISFLFGAIEGFGFVADPRISSLRHTFINSLVRKEKSGEKLSKAELVILHKRRSKQVMGIREKRDLKMDAAVMLDLETDQIAFGKEDITQKTKVYVGPLFTGIFEEFDNIEQLYTDFPEGRVDRSMLTIGGKSLAELDGALKAQKVGFDNYGWVKQILNGKDFRLTPSPNDLQLVTLSVGGLGFTEKPTYDELVKKARLFGLEICPPETAVHLCLATVNQPVGEALHVISKPLKDTKDRESTLQVQQTKQGPVLNYNWLVDYYKSTRWRKIPVAWTLSRRIVFSYGQNQNQEPVEPSSTETE